MKIVGTLILSLLIFSCGTSKKANEPELVEITKTNEKNSEVDESEKTITHDDVLELDVVGNDTDEHGCKASTGYTWSVIQNKCIRTWENGTQLNSMDKTLNAAVIFSASKDLAELFISDEKTSVILKIKGEVYTNGKYELNSTDGLWNLTQNGKLIYTGKSAENPIVGNDSDEHGCKASAGYTWSIIDNKCVRPWEVGSQLASLDKTRNASVLFDTEGKKAELFIADEKTSVILNKTAGNAIFSSGTYELSNSNNQWILKKNGTVIYKSK